MTPNISLLRQWKAYLMLSFFSLFLLPKTTQADSIETEVGSVENFGEYISLVWSWAAEVIFGVAVITLIVGGIMLMSAGGDEERASMGKQTIKGAIISTVIVLFSAVIQKVLQRPTENLQGGAKLSDTSEIITNTVNILLTVVGGVAVVGIIYSGIKYMTSAGDEEKIDSAKQGLKMSIFGLIISVSAYVIMKFLLGIWK